MLRKDLIELLIKYHLTPRRFIIKTNDIRFWKGKIDKIPKSSKPSLNNDFKKPCPICKGTGKRPSDVEDCPTCNGQGFIKS